MSFSIQKKLSPNRKILQQGISINLHIFNFKMYPVKYNLNKKIEKITVIIHIFPHFSEISKNQSNNNFCIKTVTMIKIENKKNNGQSNGNILTQVKCNIVQNKQIVFA